MAELTPQFLEVVETSAQAMRAAFTSLQEGVLDPGDLKVTAGAVGRSVDVAAGVAMVQGDSVTDQGLYRVRSSAVVNSAAFQAGPITANGTANPRMDQIIAHVFDQTVDGSGSRSWRLEVLAGVATAGATIDNRTGAALLPSSAVRLADLMVPAGATAIAATDIRDRRPWARGLTMVARRTTQFSMTGNAFNSFVQLNDRRVELSGRPVKCTLTAPGMAVNTAAVLTKFALFVDGVEAIECGRRGEWNIPSANYWVPLSVEFRLLAPAAGSHIIDIRAGTNSGAATLTIDCPEDATRNMIELVIEETHW